MVVLVPDRVRVVSRVELLVMNAKVSRSIAKSHAEELHHRALLAKSKADCCENFSERLTELRRAKDLEKVSEEAERRW